MSSVRAETFADMLEAAGRGSLKTIEGVSEEKRMKQPAEGKGHALWQVGHILWGVDFILNNFGLGLAPVNDPGMLMKFAPDIAGGPPVSADAGDYPGWDELIEGYKKSIETAAAGVRALSDDDLAGPLKGDVPEQVASFFGNLDQTISGMILHDAHHRGQIGLLAGL